MKLLRSLVRMLRESMRWQLLVLMSSASILPVVALLGGGYWMFSRYAVPQRVEFLRELAHQYDQRMVDHLVMRLDEVAAAAKEIARKGSAVGTKLLVDEAGDHPAFSSVRIVAEDGTVVFSSRPDEGPARVSYADVLTVAAKRGAAIGRLVNEPLEGGLIVPLAVMMENAEPGRMRFFVGALLWSDLFPVVQDTVRLDKEGELERFAIFVDETGRVLVTPDVAISFAPPLVPLGGLADADLAESSALVLGGTRYRATVSPPRLDTNTHVCSGDPGCIEPSWSHVVYVLEEDALATAPVRVFVQTALSVLAFAGLATIFLAWFFSERLTVQLDRLVQATGVMTSGRKAAPVPVVTRNELGVLTARFNTMADTLAESRSLLEQHTDELEVTNARLRELDETKTRLLANVSHEMRTPVAAMISAAKIIHRYHAKKPESVERFSETIMKEGHRLANLINEALDLARIESVDARWNDRELDPRSVLDEVVRDLERAAETNGVLVLVEEGDDMRRLVADRERLAQVLTNVIGNAIKFTPPGGRVTVRMRDEASAVLFEVEDTGIGIPETEIGKIFDRFYQVQDADPRREKPLGSGLGLAISKDIVERYGGRIWVESSPGRGSIFRFVIPRSGATHAVRNETYAVGL